MARTTTTLSSAVTVNDNSVVVASATGFAANYMFLIDQEVFQVAQNYVSGTTIPCLRGRLGSVTAAHVSSANVTVELASDVDAVAPQTNVNWPIAGKARTMASYSASGAIALPAMGSDAVAVINGTSALAMTLANPTKDMDGCILWIIGNGKSTSTVTYTAGFGNAGGSYDVLTAPAGGQVCAMLMACNGFWCTVGTLTGTLTAVGFAIA